MKVFWTIFWSFLLSAMIVYVLSSMSGATFDLTGAIALAGVFTLTSIILSEGVLKNDQSS